MTVSADIFLSYSRDDQVTARRFAEGFERAGFTVWWDATLHSGESYDQVTEKALNEAKAVVVLWSRKSVDSRWVRAEATEADRNKTLVPVMIESCKRPIMFELTHTADLAHWKGDYNDSAWQTYVADVRRFVDKGAPQGAQSPAAIRSHGPPAAIPWYRQRSFKIALVALVLLVAAGLLYQFARLPGQQSGIEPAASRTAAQSGVSLAVLPFVDMSPQHDQEYFSDGLSEELLNQLAQIMDLQVTGRTSSFSFKGKNEDLRVIGQKLGVNHLLEGSVRKAGDSLRITAQLIDATSGTHLWSQTYDRKLDNVFSVQEDIAKDVATALSIKLDVGEMSRGMGGTDNLGAYDKYLRARALYFQGGTENFQQSVQLYHEALALDPNFERAWYGLYQSLEQVLIFLPPDGTTTKEMSEVSARLVALAPDAWWTQAVRAAEATRQYKWSEAETAAAAATASAPSSENLGLGYGVILHELGRIQEGLPYFQRAREVDPLSLTISFSLQMALDAAGRSDEAQAEYERSKDLAGNHSSPDNIVIRRLLARKDPDGAAVKARLRDFLQSTNQTSLFGITPDNFTNKQAVLAALHQQFNDPARQVGNFFVLLGGAADLYGDKDLALAAFRRGFIDLHATAFLSFWPVNRTGLHSDPRFKQLVRDLKFADYFFASGKWNDFCHPVGKDDFECQ